ncbi:MAG: flagellar biosynthetic protein FliP, partial [Candidatus Neomarinimicrobiota bacterium]
MKIRPVLFWLALALMLLPVALQAQGGLPTISLGVTESTDPTEFGLTLKILFMMTVLSLAPSILIMMTSFTRIIIVFHFLRAALATQSAPSNQILIGLALFMTFFIMQPVLTEVNDNALQPYLREEITQDVALDLAVQPVRAFMLKQTREKDLALFLNLRQ